MKKIVLTGGGTAGHVTPNIALLPELQKKGYAVEYIGSVSGIEKELIASSGVMYHSISSGKLRRYLDPKNLSDVFRVVKGLADALRLLRKIKPDIVFSKGGFVTVPVVAAAHFLKIPVIIHESDITPGLANRMAIPFCSAVCVSFPETLGHLPEGKAVLTGSPVRESLFEGRRAEGLRICAFKNEKPVILVMGGSLGSVKINNCVRESIEHISACFNLIHICGKGNLDEEIKNGSYVQFEYVGKELPHIFACADLIVSRAGANSIYEFLALKKPNLLIPLSKEASRGDQIMNAASFEEQGFSKVLPEEEMNTRNLLSCIERLYHDREAYKAKMSESKLSNGVKEVMKLIVEKS